MTKTTEPWVHIGGDLEARYDGGHYVDIRVKGKKRPAVFLSSAALRKALKAFPKAKRPVRAK